MAVLSQFTAVIGNVVELILHIL